MEIELIYDEDCPNVDEARSCLRSALAEAGMPADWKEWPRDDPESPLYSARYGSPTILVDGVDVTGTAPMDGTASCRVYRNSDGSLRGAPPVEAIVAALRRASGITSSGGRAPNRGSARSLLATLPGIAVALLPNLACPACWPAYAGLVGALGLGFLVESRYLFPMTVVFLLLALLALGFRAGRRRGSGPLIAGIGASAAILVGKFWFEVDVVMYAGVVLLVAASVWNAWPRRDGVAAGCQECAPCDPRGDPLPACNGKGTNP